MLDHQGKNTYTLIIINTYANNGYANAPQCNVTCTLPVLLNFKAFPSQSTVCYSRFVHVSFYLHVRTRQSLADFHET